MCIRFTRAIDMDFRDYVRITLQNETEPLWFPSLVAPVVQIAWERLNQEIGLSRDSYGTTRLLLGDPNAEHRIAAYCKPRRGKEEDATEEGIPVEILAANLVNQIADSEVHLLSAHSIADDAASELDEALSLLDLVPSVWPTVSQLVRAIHIIDPCDNDTDVSFSAPSIPFSVFVSVPSMRSQKVTLRIAEAILHESMHLHLTLIARTVPLLQPAGEMQYSPWRGEERDSEGIIQALYAFSVIRTFFTELPNRRSYAVNNYVLERKKQIDSQIRQAYLFRESDELTPEGKTLVLLPDRFTRI